MSHTPGPWVFEHGSVVSVNQDDCYIGGKRPVVCNVNMLEGQDDIIIGCGGNAADNGRLLASALRMYDILRAWRAAKPGDDGPYCDAWQLLNELEGRA